MKASFVVNYFSFLFLLEILESSFLQASEISLHGT